MVNDLQGFSIMVTRPRPEGEELALHIRESGGNAIYFPVIDIIPPENMEQLNTALQQLSDFDWVIFVSPQAVYAFIHAFQGVFPQTVKVAAMGLGTANALQKARLPVHCYPVDDWRSEGLLALSDFQDIKNKKIALIRGESGREWLANELTARGAHVTHIIAYQRKPSTLNVSDYQELLQRQQIDIIVCTSNDILQQLVLLLKKTELFTVPLLVVSERMVSFAKTMGFTSIILATNASHDAIMKTLRGYLCQTK